MARADSLHLCAESTHRAIRERWPLPAASLRVLHFTLGPLKPWHWPATWLVPAATTWQDVRRRTPPPPGLMDFTPVLHAALLAASLLAIGAS